MEDVQMLFVQGSYEDIESFLSEGKYKNYHDDAGRTPLHYAAENTNANITKLLLLQNFDVNASNNWKATPLHDACRYGNIEVVKLLIDQGASLSSANDQFETPLHQACDYGQYEAAKILIENNADVSAKDAHGRTPLYFAAKEGHSNIVRLLVEGGADIHEKSEYQKWTPLWAAVDNDKEEAVKLLLEYVSSLDDRDFDGKQIIHLAKNKEMVDILIENGADINGKADDGSTLLFSACCHSGSLDFVKDLVQRGADINVVNKYRRIPLHYACETLEKDVMTYLLNKGSIIGGRGITSTLIEVCSSAVREDKELCVEARKVLEFGANVRQRGCYEQTCLHFAASDELPELVELLISYGSDVNAMDRHEDTPLLNACRDEKWSVVELLLKHGAILNIQKYTGDNALSFVIGHGNMNLIQSFVDEGADLTNAVVDACESNNVELVRYFVGLGVDANSSGFKENLPINIAATFGNKDIIDFLLDSSCDVNSVNYRQKTPLHYAVGMRSNVELVEYLIGKGSNVLAEDFEGKTPLHVAEGEVIVDLLLKHGADVNARDKHGNTPFHYACSKSDMDKIMKLKDVGADIHAVNNLKKNGLHFAAEGSHADVIQRLIELELDIHLVSDEHGNALHHAVAFDRYFAEDFIDAGISIDSVNNNHETALNLSLSLCSTRIINTLLALGADVNIPNNEGILPLHRAAHFKTYFNQVMKTTLVENIDMLLQKGAVKTAVDGDGRNMLHHSCQYADLATVTKVLSLGIELKSKDSHGRNVLHFAAINGDMELIRYLLKTSRESNNPDNNGHYPLKYCRSQLAGEFLLSITESVGPQGLSILMAKSQSDQVSPKFVRKLIGMAADVNEADDLGNTLLHYAASGGCVKSMRQLLDFGANINASNNEQQTPIYLAIGSGNLDAIKLLITHKADLSWTDQTGCSPLQYAKQYAIKTVKYFSLKTTI